MGMKLNDEEQTMETMLATTGSAALEHWSDDRRKEFVLTFEERVQASQYILFHTATAFREAAERRNFISTKHRKQLKDCPQADGLPSRPWHDQMCGGRPVSELRTLAEERAEVLAKELPPLKKAVSIIDAKLGKKIERRDALKKQIATLVAEVSDTPQQIDMADVDQDMTVAAFRQYVQEIVDKREDLYAQLSKLKSRAEEVSREVDKALYAGLPGLSDAVIDVYNQHVDRVAALDQLKRRVKETVMFGDSEAALEMLRSFEKDEVSISSDLVDRFKAGMVQLKLAGKKK